MERNVDWPSDPWGDFMRQLEEFGRWLQEEGVKQHGKAGPWWRILVDTANGILDDYSDFTSYSQAISQHL